MFQTVKAGSDVSIDQNYTILVTHIIMSSIDVNTQLMRDKRSNLVVYRYKCS